MNTKVNTGPVYDVILDLGNNVTTLERGLSKEKAEATKAATMKMFVGIRVVERIGSRRRPPR